MLKFEFKGNLIIGEIIEGIVDDVVLQFQRIRDHHFL